MKNSDAIIIGAGPAGLACAASMGALGLKATVLEKGNTVSPVWRRHYDRLHLHTDRGHSGLPGMDMPRTYPTYPSRAQVVEYLEGYAAQFRIQPVFNTTVRKVGRNGSLWSVETGQTSLSAHVVVMATGWADFPYRPAWPGSDIFRGSCIHSSEYRNTPPYTGKRVLVVGFGNSGGEIALDLAMAHIDTTLAVRGPVQILPRDLLGIPILSWAIAQKKLAHQRGRFHQCAGDTTGYWPDRAVRIKARRQGAAPDDRRGRAHSTARHRHIGQDQGWLDQGAWRD
jgi:cation diffusion facilitator CzcD-associated flavoprotein CzcO